MSLKSWVLKTKIYDFLGKRSYAQSGEDVLVVGEFEKDKRGFYVDVGAFHPKQFSNTYLFYKKGWRGIVVEPNPELCALHKEVRERDIQVNVGVGEKEKVMEYFLMSDPATNTFSEIEAQKSVDLAGRKIIKKIPMAILPLKKILYQYLPKGESIDLLSVDAEGMDLAVLKSNDWQKYRPKIVICEDMDFDLRHWQRSEVTEYLLSLDYELLGKTPYSLIFRSKKR